MEAKRLASEACTVKLFSLQRLPSGNCCRTCLLHRRLSNAVRTSRVRGNMSRVSDTAAQMLLLGAKSSWLAVREATRGTAAGEALLRGSKWCAESGFGCQLQSCTVSRAQQD